MSIVLTQETTICVDGRLQSLPCMFPVTRTNQFGKGNNEFTKTLHMLVSQLWRL